MRRRSARPNSANYLRHQLTQFWDAMDRMFALATQRQRSGSARANSAVAASAAGSAEHGSFAFAGGKQRRRRTGGGADRRDLQLACSGRSICFLAATLIAIVLTSLYLIRTNREIFARLAALSEQRSELAQKLISTQESTLRHISRELHDEFGQVLTAIGSLLGRVGNQAPEGSPLRQDLQEVREIAQSTLNNIRRLSQALHPVLLEEQGLESTLDWYIPTAAHQMGLALHYEKSGAAFPGGNRRGRAHLSRAAGSA